jgi:hypothetical protein
MRSVRENIGVKSRPSVTIRRLIREQAALKSVATPMTPETSDHFDGRRFVNPTGIAGQPFTAVPRMLLERRYTELGNGTIDYTQIWPGAGGAGMQHFFVEPGGNYTHDPMRSITDCAAYVKRYLLK